AFGPTQDKVRLSVVILEPSCQFLGRNGFPTRVKINGHGGANSRLQVPAFLADSHIALFVTQGAFARLHNFKRRQFANPAGVVFDGGFVMRDTGPPGPQHANLDAWLAQGGQLKGVGSGSSVICRRGASTQSRSSS